MALSTQNNGSERPAIYEPVPPDWLPTTSNSADLGYQNFFPPKPLQYENTLTEINVKQGLALQSKIPAETFSSKARHISALKDETNIHELEDFINQVFRRRAENFQQIPTSTFRIPSRVTLNDSKRNAWFADLANPDVPLYKLGKNIPHGLKGYDLLDYLHSNNVAIPRAVWFIRVFGSNETAAMRNKPNYNPMQYSVEWANVVTGYLKKQLGEIALPVTTRLALSIKQTFRGVLSDPDSRERWVTKFIYTLELLRIFYSEFMVDHGTFLAWLVQTMNSCNLAQAGFVARLVEDFIMEMCSSRALMRPLVEAFLSKLQEIANSPSKDALESLQTRLEDLVRRAFLSATTNFVSPRMWKAHSESIRGILTGRDLEQSAIDPHVRKGFQSIRLAMQETLRDVEKRNESLLFRTTSEPVKGTLRAMVFDVQMLNSITSTTDISALTFFDSRVDIDSSLFTHKLQSLLSWSVCPVQYGDHRPYAAMSLLRAWRDKAEDRASRHDFASPNEVIQDELFDWLDENEYAGEEGNLPAVSLLFGELVEKGLFSYDQYIQRVIARGETGLSFNEEPGSRHRMFLRVIPLYKSDPALVNQRRMALYGVRARSIPEDRVEADLKSELRNLLPEVFKENNAGMPVSPISHESILRTAARYEQIRVLKQWFMPGVRRYFAKAFQSTGETLTGALRVYYVLVDILEVMRCFRTIFEISLEVLKVSTTTDFLMAVVESLRRGLNLWVCMDAMATITQALLATHYAWKTRGVHVRCLVELLLEVDDGRFLDSASRQSVIDDAVHFSQALSPLDDSPEPVPSVLPEILLLAQDTTPDGPKQLANALWYKYRTSPNWTWVVWDNVVASLRQVPTMLSTPSERRAIAIRYSTLLLHVDLHSADRVDTQASQWFASTGFNEMRTMTSETWEVASTLCLHLAIHSALKIPTLLQGVVYPAWRIGSAIESSSQFKDLEIFLRASNQLCKDLLVHDAAGIGDGLPPVDLLEIQKLKTRRKAVYRDVDFRPLAESLPSLVFAENNEYINLDFRNDAMELRRALCCMVDFRLAAARNLGVVVAAFANPQDPKGTQESMHDPLVSALRLIFNDEEGDDRTQITAFLSPWKLAASAAVTSFVLQQIGQRLQRESTRDQAKSTLTKLVGRLLHNAITAEEADFVSEMAKGVSGAVVGEFVNAGFSRIADILNEEIDSTDTESLASIPAKVGHFLKLLSMITRPFRFEQPALPSLEETVQEKFFPNFYEKLSAIESALQKLSEEREGKHLAQTNLTEPVMFLARLLQFDLGFPGAWTRSLKEKADSLLNVILQLSVLHGGGLVLEQVAFPLLLDTVFYIFDEFPADSRSASDPFYHCPDTDPFSFPRCMPKVYCNLIRSLLRYTPQNLPTADIVYAFRDDDGVLHPGPPVQMRPWEWIESLGDAPPLDSKEQQKEAEEMERSKAKYMVRNNTSIPLEMFGARMTGEAIRRMGAEGSISDVGERMRSYFEDDLSSESIYERDWRESRAGLPQIQPSGSGNHVTSENGSTTTKEPMHRRGTPGSHRGSPALSIHTSLTSRSTRSGPPSATSSARRTQSPVISGRGDPMDVDLPPGTAGSSRAGKRKASAADIADAAYDQSMLDEASGKRGKGKSVSGKTTSKTAGKTTAAKTTRKRK